MSSTDSETPDMTSKKQRPSRNPAGKTVDPPRGKIAKPAAKPSKQQSVELIIMNGPPKDSRCKSSKEEYVDFLKKLPKKQQTELLKKEAMLTGKLQQAPLKYRLLTSNMDDMSKRYALNRMQAFQDLLPDDNEYAKQKEWFETLLRVPFAKIIESKVCKHSDKQAIQTFLLDTRQNLDSCVYGLQNAKAAILQIMAQSITNSDSVCHALGFQGQKGTGKTSLAFCGIAKTLGRPFHMVSLGGSKDSSYLSGHEYTYLGSHCGHLVDILIAADCMNPIIFFDELDKVSDSPAGQELIGNLIHLIDATQNSAIKDRYFGNINFDFSHVMFVFSFNDASKVDPILLDRMQVINIENYKVKDKIQIVKRFFLPEIVKNLGISEETILLHEDDIRYIIERYAHSEGGVRLLRQCISAIYMKVNLLLLTEGRDLGLHYAMKEISIPFVLTRDVIDTMLEHDFGSHNGDVPFGMYV